MNGYENNTIGKNARREALRAAQEGMTLIEIMIVIIIMAMIATGVAVAVVPALERAKKKDAAVGVSAVRSAVVMYMNENPGKCPTVANLTEERYLDKTKAQKDPWDREFVIKCEGQEPDVYSTGPDGVDGNEDDIR